MVVLGRSGDANREVNLAACRADAVPVVHRSSGGGAVVVGPGCLNYCLTVSLDRHPALRDVRTSYRLILGELIRALDVPGLKIGGESDMVLSDRKVGGSAQRRDTHFLLHHGTLLYRFDPALAERYLLGPVRQPAYRSGRGHADFLGNLPHSSDEIWRRLAEFALHV